MLLDSGQILLHLGNGVSIRSILTGFLSAILVWTMVNSAIVRLKRPRKVTVVGRTLLLGKWLSTSDFMVNGAKQIAKAYRQSCQMPFAIPVLREYQVLVSAPHQIEELAKAPEEVMSFHKAMDDRLFFKQTMLGFEHNDIDPHDSIPIHSLKVLLRRNLLHLGPKIYNRIKEGFDRHLPSSNSPKTSLVVPVFSFAKAIASRVNNQILFGDDLATNNAFEDACLTYSWHGAITAGVCRLLPSFIGRLVADRIMIWGGAMHAVGGRVTALVDERLSSLSNGKTDENIDLTSFVIATSKTPRERSRERLIQQMMTLLFATSHQVPPALAWAIIMLCHHKQYIEPLRDEIRCAQEACPADLLKSLPLLECFLRESARLNPLDGLSVQRKVLKPFTFSDGTHIPAGNLVAIPQQAFMRDSRMYKDPEQFDPMRFMPSEGDRDITTRYTDVNWTYPYWGSPRQSCPGRWYASHVIKQVVVHLLENYDIALADSTTLSPISWTTALLPSFETRVVFQPRPKGRI